MPGLLRALQLGALLLTSLPSPVAAHQVACEYGIAPVEPRSRIELDVQVAELAPGARSGSWQTIAPNVEYAPTAWLSLSARLGMAHIRYRAGEDVWGITDTEIGIRLRVFATEHGELIASVGLGVGLPTGNAEDGIGSGHVGMSPFAGISSQATSWLLFHGVVADHLSLAAAHEHEHGSVVAPHAAHEVVFRLGASAFVDRAYASAGGEIAYAASGEPGSVATLRGELGWLPAEQVRLAAGLDAPVAGEARFSWRARLGVAYLF